MVFLMGLLEKEEYDDYCNKYRKLWGYLKKCSYPDNEVISRICQLRGYSLSGNMPDILKEAEFVYLRPDLFKLEIVKKADMKRDLGLFSDDGKFLLLNRFIFPVKDMLGNVIALIGWFPDEKKYITSPSKMFSKKCLFFGLEQLSKTGIGKRYFLTEGIFDSLSVRATGYNCVALMGISASNYTKVLYSLFKGIVAIPDNDTEGRCVIEGDRWCLPSNCKYLRLLGKYKDIDDVLKAFDMSEVFEGVWKEPDRVVSVKL